MTPIVFNGQLYVFWPDFKLTPIEADVTKLVEENHDLTEQITKLTESIDIQTFIIGNMANPDGMFDGCWLSSTLN